MLRNKNKCPFQYRLSEMICLFDELTLYIQQLVNQRVCYPLRWRVLIDRPSLVEGCRLKPPFT